MNKFAKALLLSLVLAAPVAISTNAVQAKTANTHSQRLAMATTKKPHAMKHKTKHAAKKSHHGKSAMKK
jgi:hypothetical protein